MGEFKPSLTKTIPCVETKSSFFQATVLQITFYTLHTLIDKHVKNMKNGKIFPCFVGFKKAFDSIWHTGLYYKLVESGVGGKVFDVMESMYSQIGTKQTEFFAQNRGRAGLQPESNAFQHLHK